ncbi:MAG: type I-C CRISPR-associated protein Cas8c/Csd1 [Endomicrobium sp.]|uniref:type I-C CRISPR-associated protein Cas8c/Csd1 n=1 Tax=Candidatus Endomicrobiellum pyrsonymphae TaxID=1408203 RepID=UPI00358624E7|nr:type I-C CRISPR-associated protein Cas8c/Csd1 [Endomicrobium sp.]
MILQALKEYYYRKPDLPKFGFEKKEIPYIVVLDENGEVVNLEITYEGTGEEKRARKFLVPHSVRRTSGIVSNLLWDNPKYALGIKTKNDDERDEQVSKMHQKFKNEINLLGKQEDKGLNALKLFLEKSDKEKLLQKKFAENLKVLLEDENPLITFRLEGESDIIANSKILLNSIIEAYRSSENIKNLKKFDKAEKTICLISGEKDIIERLHPSIKGVWRARSSGANIVSFNSSAYCSYGKEQGNNSPSGIKAVFAYTTALNFLLDKKSQQKIQVGDSFTMIFWAAKKDNLENDFASFFNIPQKDDPNKGVKTVKALLESVKSGALSNDDSKTEFYVLGLSPNEARIAVRFFIKDTVRGMSENIAKHFQDLEIDRPSFESEFLPLFKLLVSTAVLGESENIAPHLAGDFMMSVLKGLPYPETILQAVINRIKAQDYKYKAKNRKAEKAKSEWVISHERVALIKAYLNRLSRKTQKEEEITVSLNKENTNQGYVLGRLFATLEKLQGEAQEKPNSTIMRYYGTASSSPVAVFSTLMRLHQHHLNKLSKEKAGRAVYFEKLIGEIQDKIDNSKGYPSYLSLTEQGMFSVGYYQQRQDFFKPKKEKTETENKIQGEQENG